MLCAYYYESSIIMNHLKKNIVELTRCSVSEYKKYSKLPFRVMADNVRSLHNIGSIFRTADAFRIDSIILAGISGVPPHPEISKTALGADESVKWYYVDNAVDEVKKLKSEGWCICVLEQVHNSLMIQDFTPSVADVPLLLVVGNEVNGVNQEIINIADFFLEIPQEGTKHSLNVATSAAIAMFHIYTKLISR